jgi:cytochrome c oxidase cbb3-type subunit III
MYLRFVRRGSGAAGQRVALLRMTCAAGMLSLSLLSCEREKREFGSSPPATSPRTAVPQVELQPGLVHVARVPSPAGPARRYAENAYAVSQGKTLYNQYNCSGCHAQGGGGMGPPLMDAEWIYGSSPENIFETIAVGRPNGMPAFGGKIVEDQMWQIAAYVRSMSGLLRKDVAPGRNDDMQVRSQEQSTEKARPRPSGTPKPAELP